MNKALIHWTDIIEEIQGISDEYEDSGWETLVLHPGDVTTTTSEADADRDGFRLVVPDSELDALEGLIGGDADAFDEFEVLGAPTEDLLLFVVVLKATDRKAAVLYPVYYDPAVDREFVETARELDVIYTDVTGLGKSRQFSFGHDNPTLFLP